MQSFCRFIVQGHLGTGPFNCGQTHLLGLTNNKNNRKDIKAIAEKLPELLDTFCEESLLVVFFF